ncbi:MAG: hypothetical protein FJY85_13640, partial [Deltaproteobacteria bacterium]|nr:hypothetical protein [Deltaproteobacteria bacterium]
QAKMLAIESKKSEPDIVKIYWFPHDSEVHLIELDDKTVRSLSGQVEAFYFDPSPEHDITVPSGIAIIRPEEYGKLTLPEGWGDWKDGEVLEVEE